MALVPAWDTRTGMPVAHLVPDHYFAHPVLGANLSPTDPAPKPAKPTEPAPKPAAPPVDPKKEA